MSLVASASEKPVVGQGSVEGLARFLSSHWLSAGMTIGAIASQAFSHQNGDNSWLFTVTEKVLDGARPYIDIIESNPPGAYLFYAPAVIFARLAHISVECAAVGFVFLVAAASIWLTGRILTRAGMIGATERGFLLNAAVFALVFLPGFSFAEREHNACLLVLPILAVYAARAGNARVHAGDAVMAGLAAVFALAIKPHFAVPIALPLIYVLARRRSLAPAFAPEQWVALAGVIANVVVIYTLFPGYFAIAPATFDAYVPLREPLSYLLCEMWFLFNVALLATLGLAFGKGCLTPRIAVPALASIGFIGTFFIQGKGWVNHGLPGDELAFLAIAAAIAPVLAASAGDREEKWARIRRHVLYVFMPVVIGAPILFGVFLPLTGFEEYKGLTAAVLRHAPPHPRVIALSPRLDVGHPLTRRIGGEWVGRPNAIWLMVFSRMFLDAGWGDAAKRARFADYIERDARGFHEDVETGKPDIVLVLDDDRIAKAMQHPEVAAAMAGYEPVDAADGVAVWTRRR